jgi:hypothetical protein
MLAVCLTAGGDFNIGRTVNGSIRGKRDIFTLVAAVWFISCFLLVNEHKTAQPSSCTTTRNLVNEIPQDEI